MVEEPRRMAEECIKRMLIGATMDVIHTDVDGYKTIIYFGHHHTAIEENDELYLLISSGWTVVKKQEYEQTKQIVATKKSEDEQWSCVEKLLGQVVKDVCFNYKEQQLIVFVSNQRVFIANSIPFWKCGIVTEEEEWFVSCNSEKQIQYIIPEWLAHE